MKTKFDSEPVYGDNDKYIKTKIKSYGDKINTNFQGKKIPPPPHPPHPKKKKSHPPHHLKKKII